MDTVNDKNSSSTEHQLIELLQYCLRTRNDLEWALAKEDHLREIVSGIESTDVMLRKVSFSTLLILLNFWKRNKRIKFPNILKNYFYDVRHELFFSYNTEREAEYEYFSQKKVKESIEPDHKCQNLMYFVPLKYLKEGRVYMMTFADIERITKKKGWVSLPDPKAIYAWIRARTGEDISQEAIGYADDITPSSAKSKRPERLAITILRRQSTKSKENSGSNRSCSNKPSRFQSSPKKGSSFKSEFNLNPQFSDEKTSRSGLSDEISAFGSNCQTVRQTTDGPHHQKSMSHKYIPDDSYRDRQTQPRSTYVPLSTSSFSTTPDYLGPIDELTPKGKGLLTVKITKYMAPTLALSKKPSFKHHA